MTIYQLLPSEPGTRTTRVLDVQAARSTDDPNEPIRGQLRIVDLKSEPRPRYSALSYVWGQHVEAANSIICGSQSILIQPNAHSALRHLRKKLGSFTIWIDAICINQDDKDEKENQIPLMGDIFSQAEFVYIWLGEGDERTQRAIAWLREPRFLKYFYGGNSAESGTPKPRPWAATVRYLWEGLKPKKTLFPSSRSHRRWASESSAASFADLQALLDSEWLERIWAYQEILLATNPVVVCGDDHILWSTFSFSIAFLEYTGIVYRERGPRLASLRAWARLALSRDHMLNSVAVPHISMETLKQYDPKHRSTSSIVSSPRIDEGGARNTEGSDLTVLRQYVAFINTVIGNFQTIKALIAFPLSVLGYLKLPIIITGFAAWYIYRDVQQNIALSKSYNQQISTMIRSVVASQFNAQPAKTKADAVETATFTISMVTGVPIITPRAHVSKTTSTLSVTEMMELLSMFHKSTTLSSASVFSSAIGVMLPAVTSAVGECWSSCSSNTNRTSCFQSCTATNTIMPTLRTVSIQEADIPSHRPQLFYWGVMWTIVGFISIFFLFGLVNRLMHAYRSGASMARIESPDFAVDLVDGLCTRKAKYDHDKAFALRAILQRLLPVKFPRPDYSRSLKATYEELNIHLLKAGGSSQLLFVAPLCPLTGSPSWMPDWSRNIDRFWLAQTLPRPDREPPRTAAPARATLGMRNSLTISAQFLCLVTSCFPLCETDVVFRSDQESLHFDNLNSCLRMYRDSKEVAKESTSSGVYTTLEKLCAIAIVQAVGRKAIGKWTSFLRANHGKPTHDVFRSLVRNSELFQFHIHICNTFAKNRRQIFWYKSPPECVTVQTENGTDTTWYYHYFFGICLQDVLPCDQLILVSGVPTPLLVRGTNNTQLISPAIVRGVFDRKTWRGDHGSVASHLKRERLVIR